jgi:hypothetical protein
VHKVSSETLPEDETTDRLVLVRAPHSCLSQHLSTQNNFVEVSVDLPGRCTEINWYWMPEEESYDSHDFMVAWEYRTLCDPEIAGIVIGVVGGATITSGACWGFGFGRVMRCGGDSGSDMDYTAL